MMADISVLTRFEVSLPEKVVQDLLSPGKTFESEIWKQNEGENVQAGSSILLQKLGDSMLKLLVTVYQPSQALFSKPVQNDVNMQTDKAKTGMVPTQTDSAVVETSAMQTDPKATDARPTQTPVSELECSSMQTDQKSTNAQPTQTPQSVVESAAMQTEAKDTGAQVTQTEPKVTGAQKTQTEPKPSGVQPTQTPVVGTDSSHMQTDAPNLEHQLSQTESASFNDSFMQTDIKKFVDSSMQTDYDICDSEMQTDIMCFERFEQMCQTSVETSENAAQIGAVMCNQDMQTELELREMECQTDIKEYAVTDIQTDMSMALQREVDCQAVVSIAEGACQAVVDSFDGCCQAVVESSESECQVMPEQREFECQVCADVAEMECQVNPEVVEIECQASVEQSAFECQFSPENVEIDIQTGVSFSMLEEGECQTEDTTESRSVCLQTEATKIKTKTVQTDPENIGEAEQTGLEQPMQNLPDASTEQVQQYNPEMMAQQGEFQHTHDDGMPNISIMNAPENVGYMGQVGQGNDDMPTIVSIEPVQRTFKTEEEAAIVSIEPLKKGDKADPIDVEKEGVETGCQTDPVTIIIGDASFLVQRLRSSAVNPAKVEGNEIEIEVGPENEKKNIFSPDPYHELDDRPTHRRSFTPRGSQRSPRGQRVNVKKEKSTFVKKEKVVLPSIEQLLPPPNDSNPVPKLPPPGSTEIGKFSCPFCALTFHESPALYEHLQVDHSNITSTTLVKTPKSASKKATFGKRKRGSNIPPELEAHDDMIERINEPNHEGEEPPVLTPYEMGEYYPGAENDTPPPPDVYTPETSKVHGGVYGDVPPGDEEGPGLFEDVPEPKGFPNNQMTYGKPPKGASPFKKAKDNSPLEFDCPMCYEKFGTADILFLHIKKTHREEEEKRQRRDVVSALMHDTMSAVGKRRMPLPVSASDSSRPIKRRRTKEVLEEFEEAYVEDMGPEEDLVEPLDPEERLRELDDDEEDDEEELPPDDMTEELAREQELAMQDQQQLIHEQNMVTAEMLDDMVEVVIHKPTGVVADEQPGEENELEGEHGSVNAAEEPAQAILEPQPVKKKGRGRPKKVHVIEKIPTDDEDLVEEIESPSTSSQGLRRTRHSTGQGPPRPSPRTRGGRSNRP